MHHIEAPVDLDETLASGQTFAFLRYGDGFAGVVNGKPLAVWQDGAGLTLECPQDHIPFWENYFDISRDYTALLSPFDDDETLSACRRGFGALRLLRQPVWETICAFIISANNNQRRIESIYQSISRTYGEPFKFDGHVAYSFPDPQTLASAPEEMLLSLGAGYRAPYLINTAGMVAGGFSLNLSEMTYNEAFKHLQLLPGVGPKVADCVLLFATCHGCAFPVDVWMDRVMRNLYGFTGTRASVRNAAMARFGNNAGLVQQLLFHGARSGLLKFEI